MKANLTISKAVPDDAEDWARVHRETWLATYPSEEFNITEEDILSKDFDSPEKLKIRRESFANPGNNFCNVAKVDGVIVGFGVAGKSDNYSEIKSLYVLPEFQCQGIGKALMQRCLGQIGDDKDILLNVVVYNKKAIHLYESFGFKFAGGVTDEAKTTLPSGKKLPLIRMVKEL